MAGELTTLAEAKNYMGVTTSTDDDLIESLIDTASQAIKDELKTDIVRTTYTNQVYNGTGHEYLYLDNYPILKVDRASIGKLDIIEVTNEGTGVTHARIGIQEDKMMITSTIAGVVTSSDYSLSDYDTVSDLCDAVSDSNWEFTITSGYSDYPATELVNKPPSSAYDENVDLSVMEEAECDYQIESYKNAVLRNPYVWDEGYHNVFVTYDAGYDSIPNPIQEACNQLVKFYYDLKDHDSSLTKETIGDYSYSLGVWAGVTQDPRRLNIGTIRMLLLPYRRDLIW